MFDQGYIYDTPPPEPVKTLGIFETRCQADPHGVIKDLLGQTSRQAKAIHDLSIVNEQMKTLLEKAGIEVPAIPVEVKKRGRTKKVIT